MKHLESALSEVLPIKSNLYSVCVQNKADHGLSSQRIIFVYLVYLDVILNLFEEGVGLVGIEDFVAVHDCYEVFGVA